MGAVLKMLPVAAKVAAGNGHISRKIEGWAVLALCAVIGGAFLTTGVYQALLTVFSPPWPALLVGLGFVAFGVAFKVLLVVRATREARRRRAELDPAMLAAAGFLVGALCGPERAERHD